MALRISIRSKFILISVSITLLAVSLFASAIHKKAIKYKHSHEIQVRSLDENHLNHLNHEIIGVKSLEKLKKILNAKLKSDDGAANFYAVLNDSNVFHINKNAVDIAVLEKIYVHINNETIKGKIKHNDETYFWALNSLSFNNKSTYKLLSIYTLSGSGFFEFITFFGLPFFISAFILCWIMVWSSIILSSLVIKLENQKKTLSEQAVDIEKSRDIAMKANLAKSNFLANMSHEIRTPLTSIIGFAESCRDVKQTMNDRLKAIKTIIRSGKHLMYIINDILDLSKIESGKFEIEKDTFSLLTLVKEIEQLVVIFANEKDIQFKIINNYPLPKYIISDQLRLKQVLLNLCSNAIKFTEKGYVHLCVSYNHTESLISFEVMDTGIGLTLEQKEKIFKPFEQADASITRRFGGTGLGLTLSKKFIDMLNGKLIIESEINKGSCFSVVINIPDINDKNYVYEKDYNDLLSHDNLVATTIPNLEGKVLVVEDNLDIQELIKVFFKYAGVKYDVVENGQVAVEYALNNKYELVFMDIQMPVMDGITAMKLLQKEEYKIPVIAMTANTMKKDRESCKAAGFFGFISKPIDREKLYSMLKIHMNSKKLNEKENAMITSSLLIDEPDLIDLIDKFMVRLPEIQKKINSAYESKDEDEFSKLIHQLKGVGGGYGYPILTELCAKIEYQLSDKNIEDVAELITELNNISEQIIKGKDENHKIASKAE